MSDFKLVCNDIVKKYGKKEILHNIDLEIEPGKIYGLIGRNGAGKTTLLSVLSAQTPATSGNVTYSGMQVWENQEALDHICFSRELNAISAYGPNNLKVKDYFKSAEAFFPNWDKEMAKRLCIEFGLEEKKRISKLSKGMMSMVTIIIALASKADITFMDEPVAGLDVVARDQFYRELLNEYTETGRTFIVSTHIIEEAADLFEETILLKDGNILLKENTLDLLDRAFHISGKAEDVDAFIQGLPTYRMENIGRSKGATVLLNPGQELPTGFDVTVQPVSLQNLFVALCGQDAASRM
ncbi:MAG: ABC transporter ATP-binding protein [Lachnospiraceae bacterium]|nr:ABC transporter ATP-binding protein [Lachnospiraceae bacterium]